LTAAVFVIGEFIYVYSATSSAIVLPEKVLASAAQMGGALLATSLHYHESLRGVGDSYGGRRSISTGDASKRFNIAHNYKTDTKLEGLDDNKISASSSDKHSSSGEKYVESIRALSNNSDENSIDEGNSSIHASDSHSHTISSHEKQIGHHELASKALLPSHHPLALTDANNTAASNNHVSTESRNSVVAAIIGSVLGGIILLIVAGMVLYCLKLKPRRRREIKPKTPRKVKFSSLPLAGVHSTNKV
jgi:hypothetical protein